MLELSYRKILAVAVPLMFGTFVQSVVMLTDTAFVSELGTIQFNAVNNAGLIYFSLFMFSKGLADGSQILIARKYEEANLSGVSSIITHTQFLQIVLCAILFTIFFFFSTYFIDAIVSSKATGAEMVNFLQYRSWGIFFAGMQVSLVAFFIGIGQTRIVLITTLVMAFGNIFLDYALIFGNYGFPKMGLKGAALASSLAELISFIVILLYFIYSEKYKAFRNSLREKLNSVEIFQLTKISVPLMFQGFIALFGWLIFFTLIEREMTAHDLEVSSVVRSIYFIAFIPIFGFGSTTRTFVSNLVGQKKLHLIPMIQGKIIRLSLLSVLIICHGAILYPESFIPLIDANPAILENTASVLRLVSGSILLFSVVTVHFNSVAALGKSNITFLIEVASMIIYLVACYLFIVTWRLEIYLVWWVEYIYFGTIGIFSYIYLIYHKRKYFNL